MLGMVQASSASKTLKIRLGRLRRQETETLLERDALLGKLVIRGESRRMRGLRGRTIRGNFLFIAIKQRPSIVVSPRRPLRRFPSHFLPPATAFVRHPSYLERVHALALVVQIIHQIPTFITFVHARRVVSLSFVPCRISFRAAAAFDRSNERSARASRVDPSRAARANGAITIEFVWIRSFAVTHMSSSLSSLSSASSANDDLTSSLTFSRRNSKF